MRRLLIAVLVVAVSAAGAATAPPPAAAVDPARPTFTADTLPTWQTDGVVWASETAGGVVYVAGTFNNVRPPGAASGTQLTPRTNFAAFSAATGDLLPCAPAFTYSGGPATIRALEASPDGSRLYVGGLFGTAAGAGVSNLVSLDTATCTLTSTTKFRRPAVNATVRAISATTDTLYIGGDLSAVDGQTRSRFAAFTTAGTLTAAQVTLNLPVRAITAAPEYGKVIVGGDFTSVNGSSSTSKLVGLDPTSGAVVQTYPGFIPTNSVPKALVRDADSFYLGAEGTGGGVFDGRLKGRLDNGQLVWKDECLGATQGLAVHDGVLYSASHAHNCQNTPGGFPEHNQRHHLLAQRADTKEILPWTPNTNGGLGEALGPRAITVTANALWVVGEFTTVENVGQQGIVRFKLTPDTGHVNPPILSATSLVKGKVRVSFTAGYDNDDNAVTYELFESGNTVPVWTDTIVSRVWARPRVNVVLDVPAGETRKYRIRTFEGTNLSPKGAEVSVTSATTTEAYRGDVWLDAPYLNWRLDETSGTSAADSSGSNRSGSYANSPSLGGGSALENGAGTSVGLNGSNQAVQTSSTTSTPAPSVFSVEAWFKTSTTRGGKIVGFGSSRTGTSGSFDRHIYMTNSGNLVFGVYNGTVNTLKSPGTYRDDKWHHVVGTQGPEGMRLYVDGQQVLANSVSSAQSYNGFWRVGGDNLSGWTDRPTSNFFAGSVDEVAVYSTSLPAARVFQHFRSARPSAVVDTQAPTTPSGVAATAGGAAVDVAWNASTDNLFLAGYQVHRGTSAGFTPSAQTQVGISATTTYRDSAVPPGTWYYKVIAFDGSDNKSGASSASTAVAVVDSTPPSAPAAPTASVLGDEVQLTWAQSTDNVGVTGYRLYRTAGASDPLTQSAQVYSGTTRSFTEVGVPAGTWHYRVVAVDAAGNTSPASPVLTVTTTASNSSLDFASVDQLAPAPAFTVTQGSTSTIPGSTTLIKPDDAAFTYRGAGGFQYGSTFPDTLLYQPTSRYPYSWGSPSVYSVEFVTDAPVFEVYTKYANTAQSIQVKVDGKRTSAVPRLVNIPSMGSRMLYKVDFGSSKSRRITLEQSFTAFGGVYVPAGSSVTKSQVSADSRWVVMGDSISGGSAANTGLGNGTWVFKAGDYLGWNDAWNTAIGGTGYIADNKGASTSMQARVQRDVADVAPDRAVFWAGYNDQGYPQSQIASAASATFNTLKQGSPSTRGYVVGPWSPSGTVGTALASTDETLRVAAAGAGFPFISPITGKVYGASGQLVATQPPWITGTGKSGAPAGDGNADQYVGSDGIHPTDAGHLYIAQRMSLALEQILMIETGGDSVAPSAPTNVSAQADAASVAVSWTASTDNVGVASYEVHRGASASFTPSATTAVGSATAVSFTESGVPAGTWYYKVLALDAAGNRSAPSAASGSITVSPGQGVVVTVQPTADTFVNAGVKSANYGTSQTMISDSVPEQYALMRFALPAAPTGLRLTSAVLTVKTTSSTSAGSVSDHEVRFADNGWNEATVTYNDRPQLAPSAALGQLRAPTAVSTSYDIPLDATALGAAIGTSTTLAVAPLGDDSLLLWTMNASSGKPILTLTYS